MYLPLAAVVSTHHMPRQRSSTSSSTSSTSSCCIAYYPLYDVKVSRPHKTMAGIHMAVGTQITI